MRHKMIAYIVERNFVGKIRDQMTNGAVGCVSSYALDVRWSVIFATKPSSCQRFDAWSDKKVKDVIRSGLCSKGTSNYLALRAMSKLH